MFNGGSGALNVISTVAPPRYFGRCEEQRLTHVIFVEAIAGWTHGRTVTEAHLQPRVIRGLQDGDQLRCLREHSLANLKSADAAFLHLGDFGLQFLRCQVIRCIHANPRAVRGRWLAKRLGSQPGDWIQFTPGGVGHIQEWRLRDRRDRIEKADAQCGDGK